MECKLLDCHETADKVEATPFGRANLCSAHAEGLHEEVARAAAGLSAMKAKDRPILEGLIKAGRYGPLGDPPLDRDSRGPKYARPDGQEVG